MFSMCAHVAIEKKLTQNLTKSLITFNNRKTFLTFKNMLKQHVKILVDEHWKNEKDHRVCRAINGISRMNYNIRLNIVLNFHN